MSLIPTQHVEPRDAISLRLDRAVNERLRQDAAFIRSPKDYVIAQALERLLRSDREFAQWLAARPRETPAGEARTGHDPAGAAPTGCLPRRNRLTARPEHAVVG